MWKISTKTSRWVSVCREAQRFSTASSLESLAVREMAGTFRRAGHLEAHLDPLGLQKPAKLDELHKKSFAPLIQSSSTIALDAAVHLPNRLRATGDEIYNHLKETYCGKIGYEFEHLNNKEEREWFAMMIEGQRLNVLPSERRNAYVSMLMAEEFEKFMAKKFSSFKRYSGEGAESMMPAIQTIFAQAAKDDISDIVIGMPHRGRLALLVGLLEYPLHQLIYKVKGYTEFPSHIHGVDDVTSHIAQSVDKNINGKNVHVSLLHNPSHLEIINAVATGKVRAKNDHGANAMTLLLHGDAAFSGQGCVPEGLSLSQLPSFSTNGSVHIVVNNQVGFTTTKRDGRSSHYCSDVAKGFEIPVIHVNGESIDHVIQAAQLATQYRNKFHKDIVIDLVTYRRHGHNEVDEPRFTQPEMYANIISQTTLPSKYSQELIDLKLMTNENVAKLQSKFQSHLEKELQIANSYTPTTINAFERNWSNTLQPSHKDLYSSVSTGVNLETLKEIGERSVNVPADFKVHDRLQRSHIQNRLKMLSKDSNLSNVYVDWATAEAMAFGSLLREGHSIRLSGQDCRRGTFSQRHAAFTNQVNDPDNSEMYFPFKHLDGSKGLFHVVNSNLSELAVMGFEYGYSWEDPKNLVIWEAQFGDFFNGAQIVIDQFLASGESKWMRQSGLVLLLPHGYDGAGPDHSSGKPERFLQLCDSQALKSLPTDVNGSIDWKQYEQDYNMIVVNPTTPANYFHLLRRQQLRNFRKPLVVMAPKTLLRLPEATSSLADMDASTSFQPVIGDAQDSSNIQNVNKVLFCSGKLYYELVKTRKQHGHHNTAIIRVEELSPFPFREIDAELKKYKNIEQLVWVQEEPANQGAWIFVRSHFEKLLPDEQVQYIGRESIPTSAVGMSKRNSKELESILKQAFP